MSRSSQSEEKSLYGSLASLTASPLLWNICAKFLETLSGATRSGTRSLCVHDDSELGTPHSPHRSRIIAL